VGSAHDHDRAASISVPDSMSAALLAQLDQLGPAKEVAQHASVIGHEFSVDLLSRIGGLSPDQLLTHLDRLVQSRIVIPSASSPDLYAFKHALVRDIAYGSLLKKRCRDLHGRIARELAERRSTAIGATDDLIAQHFSLADEPAEGVRYWLEGANKANARAAHEEALGMLRSAFEDFGKLRGVGSQTLELELVMAQLRALRAVRGYSAPEVEQQLLRARELCSTQGDGSNRFNIEWGLFQCTIVKDDVVAAGRIASTLFQHAARHPSRPAIDAYIANGMVAFHLGEFERARGLFASGNRLGHPETDQPHFFSHAQNPGLFCLSYFAWTQCFLGRLDLARATIERALAIATARGQESGHIYSYVTTMTFAVRVYQLCDDIPAAQRLAEEIIKISRRNHYAYYEALGTCYRGWTIGAGGSLRRGIDEMLAGIAAVERTGTLLALRGSHALLALLYLLAHQWDDAERTLDHAMARGDCGTRVWDAEIERVRGNILASRPRRDMVAAEAAYRTSLAIARRQNASALALKAAAGLAEVLERLDRGAEGCEILGLCLDALPEGFEVEHVRTARETIRRLARKDRR
jgi:predicted ATPase